MAHHLNTNKQFMIGNGILAFGVIVVVVIFVYISMRAQREQGAGRYYTETYNINLTRGFVGDSISILINDSVLADKLITEEPFVVNVARFDDQSTLIIMDNLTEKISLFELSERGGDISLIKDADGIKQLAQ